MEVPRLSERECGLVRELLDVIMEREPELPDLVYPRLFDKSPAARKLFGRFSQVSRRQMLVDTIVAIVDLVDDDGWVRGDLEGLGSLHRHTYAVEAPMYDAWADAVVEGLAEALGESFTREHASAFRNALEYTNDMMRAGAYPERRRSAG